MDLAVANIVTMPLLGLTINQATAAISPAASSATKRRVHAAGHVCGPCEFYEFSKQHLGTTRRSQQNCNFPGKHSSRSRGTLQVGASAVSPPQTTGSSLFEEPAKKNLLRAAHALRRYGWFSFWTQLTLSVVSSIILLFSIAFTSQGPGVSLYLTIFGVIAGFFSTFWAYGYTRLARKLNAQLAAGPGSGMKRVKRTDVQAMLERGAWVNLFGVTATLVGLQATVGLLVAKTLTNATANPFLSGGVGAYNPVLALDVFLVQMHSAFSFAGGIWLKGLPRGYHELVLTAASHKLASTNTLMSHFVSLIITLWLLKVIGRAPAPMPAVQPAR